MEIDQDIRSHLTNKTAFFMYKGWRETVTFSATNKVKLRDKIIADADGDLNEKQQLLIDTLETEITALRSLYKELTALMKAENISIEAETRNRGTPSF
ncbi:hypothetical protein [Microcystis sp. M42BS1]|uniref:hypothetical protein n=1 Tax=Microcystis sp. M42BS1 TaxID=2771192 RepID=UPI002586999E|nr:hypothetical protein [Microcystis sp. M42BS1]MCA2570687.1 hypothetical protein [Microcystis sp. M42BS1]